MEFRRLIRVGPQGRPNQALHLTRPRSLFPVAPRASRPRTGVAAGQVSWVVRRRGWPMLLFASRPSRTYFSESPLGWYSYRWDMATTPAFVEFWEWDSFAFLAAHLLVVVAGAWLLWLRAARRPK